MPTPDDIRDAAAAGIISAEQAERLAAFLAERVPIVTPSAEMPAVDPDEESIRFVRGFQDIFLTIGIVLLLFGVSILGANFLEPVGGVLIGAVVSYVLAIGFARRRRLLLPSMALALGFVLFTGYGVANILGGDGFDVGRSLPALQAGTFAALAAAGVFYASFRLPFALGLIAGAALAAASVTLRIVAGDAFAMIWPPALLGFGLLTFAAAMAFDLTDPERRTLRADNAFWLHLAAAPMIVHAAISLLVGSARMRFSPSDALIVVALVAALALVALIIDRRALFVSALSYFGFAIAVLVREANLEAAGGLAATLVLTGSVVIALGTAWRAIRRVLLGRFPRRGILLRLPPVGNSATNNVTAGASDV